MSILVTGATGFLGQTVVTALEKQNLDVKKIGHSKKNDLIDFNVDLSDRFEVEKLKKLQDVEAIIHCAGLAHQFGKIDEQKFYDVNVKGTINILEIGAQLKIKHFILISSVSVYGDYSIDPSKYITEEYVCRPVGVYADSKFKSELEATKLCEKYQIPLTILRPSTIVGEGDKGNVSRLIKSIKNGKFLWIGNGLNMKSLVYKNDVAATCLHLLSNKKTNRTEIFNVTSYPISMKEIVEEIERSLSKNVLGFAVNPKLLDIFFAINRKTLKFKKVEKIDSLVRKWLSDEKFSGDKLRKEYGFSPKTDIKEAIQIQIKDYLKTNV